MSTKMLGPKARGKLFRELVMAVLADDGHAVTARPERPHRKLSESFAEEAERGDVHGLPTFVLNTKIEHTRDLSTALDEAKADATHDGKTRYAVAWHRPGRPGADSYVVMPLGTFSGLVAELQERDR